MATAKKLKSGSWRCQVYDYTDQTGKRHYKSFTCSDPSPKGKRKAEAAAAAYAAKKEAIRADKNLRFRNMTTGQAIDNYIENRSMILSPSTIREYKRYRNKSMQDLMSIKLYDLTQDDIQASINNEALNHSPKTVRNIHGLLSTVLHTYRPDFAIATKLPPKKRPDIYVPTDKDIQILIKYLLGNEVEVPVLLAAFGPMRRGEICALRYEDISGNIVHSHRSLVLDEHKKWVEKPPKTYSSDRYIEFPEFIIEKIGTGSGRLVSITPDALSSRFSHILENAGLPHFRFHDLRHYCASIQHALGIPDVYIMQRGGWASDSVLKNVYRHTMSDRQQEMNLIANQHFQELCNTKCNTIQKNP